MNENITVIEFIIYRIGINSVSPRCDTVRSDVLAPGGPGVYRVKDISTYPRKLSLEDGFFMNDKSIDVVKQGYVLCNFWGFIVYFVNILTCLFLSMVVRLSGNLVYILGLDLVHRHHTCF